MHLVLTEEQATDAGQLENTPEYRLAHATARAKNLATGFIAQSPPNSSVHQYLQRITRVAIQENGAWSAIENLARNIVLEVFPTGMNDEFHLTGDPGVTREVPFDIRVEIDRRVDFVILTLKDRYYVQEAARLHPQIQQDARQIAFVARTAAEQDQVFTMDRIQQHLLSKVSHIPVTSPFRVRLAATAALYAAYSVSTPDAFLHKVEEHFLPAYIDCEIAKSVTHTYLQGEVHEVPFDEYAYSRIRVVMDQYRAMPVSRVRRLYAATLLTIGIAKKYYEGEALKIPPRAILLFLDKNPDFIDYANGKWRAHQIINDYPNTPLAGVVNHITMLGSTGLECFVTVLTITARHQMPSKELIAVLRGESVPEVQARQGPISRIFARVARPLLRKITEGSATNGTDPYKAIINRLRRFFTRVVHPLNLDIILSPELTEMALDQLENENKE